MMLKDLVSRNDLNLRAARVLDKSWTEAAQHPGRVPVEMVTVKVRPGKKGSPKVQIWVKLDNLAGPILDPADMTAPPYNGMTVEERTEASLRMLEPQKPAPAPAPAAAAIPSSDHENPWDFSDSEDDPALAPAAGDPAPALAPLFSTRAGMIDKVEMLDQTIYESIETPAPAPAPAPAGDRRAAARDTLRNMMQEHCPRPHYCIYCGSEGLYGDKCVPCGFYRGSHCFGPNGPLQKGDTLMGRKLAFVKWPWQGEPDAPYVRAGAAPDAEPEPAPEVALTPDENYFADVGMHMQRWDTDQSGFAEGVYLAHTYEDDDYFAPGTVELCKGKPPGLDMLQWAPRRFLGSPGEQTIAIKDIVSVSVVETTFDVAFVVHDPAPSSSSKPWLRDAPYVHYHLDFAAYADDYDNKDTNGTTLPAHERFYAALTSMMGNDDLVHSTTSAKIATGMLSEPEFLRVRTAGRPPKNEPKSKYAVDPPPVRAMTRDEVLGPNPCAEVCPKYPNCTAARLVAYVLGKVDHVTSGVKSDFRYHLQTNEDWRKTRERIIKIHEAGEENAAEVLHEEYLVAHHTLSQTPPEYLPADWDGMKRRVKARQKKDKGAEAPEALAYPASDADEDEVAAYLKAKVRQLELEAAPKPELSAFGNPKPERKGDPWGVAAFFEQLLKELPYYHREEMAEILKGETIKDFEVGKVIDGRNSYEKSLTVSLTKTPCEDSDDEDSDHASVPAESTTKTITLNTYITPYDDNNAGVWLVDDTGYEHELCGVGTIPCPGGEPVRSFNKARAYQCAQYVVAYLVHGRLWWKEY